MMAARRCGARLSSRWPLHCAMRGRRRDCRSAARRGVFLMAAPQCVRSPAGAKASRRGADGLRGRRQSGVALIVALVVLVAVTVVTTSAMSTATLQIVMAGNVTSYDLAFQAASSGIDLAIARGGFSVESPGALPLTRLGDGASAAAATIVFSEATPVPGAAFSLGEGFAGLQAFHFEIAAVGTGPRNAVSTQRQGFYVLGPVEAPAP